MQTKRRRRGWWLAACGALLLAAGMLGCSGEGTGATVLPTAPGQEQRDSEEGDRPPGGSLDTWWSNLSQSQRNQAIVARGYQQLNQVTYQQCKEWVRTVVRDASQQAVLIPATQPNGWQWYGSSHVRLVAQNQCPANLQSGHIIQMRISSSGLPHTAIVYARGQAGMLWLDANWVNYNNPPGTVAIHFVSWSQFYQLTNQYSIYEIIG